MILKRAYPQNGEYYLVKVIKEIKDKYFTKYQVIVLKTNKIEEDYQHDLEELTNLDKIKIL